MATLIASSPRRSKLRGLRTHNLKGIDLDLAAGQADRGDGRERSRQELAGPRHALCRRPEALRRDLLALYAAVPGEAGQTRRRPDRGHSARDRAWPTSWPALRPEHGRHDHRDPRRAWPALRTGRPGHLPQLRPPGRARFAGERLAGHRSLARRHALRDRLSAGHSARHRSGRAWRGRCSRRASRAFASTGSRFRSTTRASTCPTTE